MNRNQIEALTKLLPADAKMFTDNRPPGSPPLRLAERLAIGVSDPAFCFKFAMHFIERSEPLPAAMIDPTVRLAYYHYQPAILDHCAPDRAMLEVEKLVSPGGEFIHSVLNGLLVCPNTKLGKIADDLNLSASVVAAYSLLHFNVRDREPGFTARLVFPDGRIPGRHDPAVPVSFAQRLLVAGYLYGPDEVLWQAGIETAHANPPSFDEAAREFERALVQNALHFARVGGLNETEAPGIDRATALVRSKHGGNRGGRTPESSTITSSISLYDAALLSMGVETDEQFERAQAAAIARSNDVTRLINAHKAAQEAGVKMR